MTIHFQYAPEIFAQFPQTVGGILVGHNLQNGPTSAALVERFAQEQQDVLARIGSTPLSELPALTAWRQVFRQFGVNPTKTRSAPEALLRRLTKAGDIPNINTLVDIGNLISIRYAMPVAVFDTRHVQGPITVHLANGAERYTELGSSELLHPEPGEVVFSDETSLVVARRWCWRQSAESAAQTDTTNVVIAIEAQHAEGHDHVRAAVEQTLALLREFAGGEYVTKILDKNDGVC
ncbi:MAG: phenylalanine--tRNA ligase beta subunit-related protein [Caldilineaceae bacterium]